MISHSKAVAGMALIAPNISMFADHAGFNTCFNINQMNIFQQDTVLDFGVNDFTVIGNRWVGINAAVFNGNVLTNNNWAIKLRVSNGGVFTNSKKLD